MSSRFYDVFSLNPSGMLSVYAFPTPRNNRKVQFRLPAAQAPLLDIYLMMDGKLQPRFFSNGSAMSTPVTFGESFWPRPHDSAAILVSKAKFYLDGLSPGICDILLTCDGYEVAARFQSSLQLTIQCSNTRALAEDYLHDGCTDPEADVRNTLVRQFSEAAERILTEELPAVKDLIRSLPELCGKIREEAIRKTYQKYRWLTVSDVSFTLKLLNTDEILPFLNKKITDDMDIRRKIIEKLIASLGTPLLTPELTELIKAHINSLPAFEEKEVFDFIERLRPLLQTYPAWMIESVIARYLGMEAPGKGASHEALL